MGGGGLRILGHKKWHVWRRENIERVHRDERLHEEAQAKERGERRKRDQEKRREELEKTPPTEHFHLFGKEERESWKAKAPKKKTDTLGEQTATVPWYAKTPQDTVLSSKQERKRKREQEEQDPVSWIQPASDYKPKTSKKHKTHKEDLRTKLRRERQEREAKERKKAEKLVHGHSQRPRKYIS